MTFSMLFPGTSLRARASLVALALTAACHAQAPPLDEDIRGPRGLIEIPAPPPPPVALWSGIGAGALGLLGAFLFYRKFSRRNRQPSPRDIAMAALGNLATTRETLSAEAFANSAATTLRSYIAHRFGLAAPRRTTEEFLRHLAGGPDTPLASFGDSLRSFLHACDLAKFAGATLTMKQRDDLLDAARAFVQATAASAESPRKDSQS